MTETNARPLPLAAQGTALVVLACVLLGIFVLLPRLHGPAAPEADAPGGAAPPADSVVLTQAQWVGLQVRQVGVRALAPLVQADGRIALDEDLDTPVFSPYSGHVTAVMARLGEIVAAGQPLFAVQSNELAQAQADAVSTQAALRIAHAQLDLAAANERRQHLLFLGHGAAQRDYQQSQADLATARDTLSAAEIAAEAVRNRLAILGVSGRAIRAIGRDAGSTAGLSANSVVRAPIAGTVTQRQINPGQNIVGAAASQGSIGAVFVIGNTRRVWMVAGASEHEAARFHLGDRVRVVVPACPGRVFEGTVAYIAPVIDPATHRLLLRAEIANPDGALKPDMLAQFDILTGAAARVLAVPATAIVYDGADAHVWVADAAPLTITRRAITAGAERDGVVEVPKGLDAHDRVVTRGAVFMDRMLPGAS